MELTPELPSRHVTKTQQGTDSSSFCSPCIRSSLVVGVSLMHSPVFSIHGSRTVKPELVGALNLRGHGTQKPAWDPGRWLTA